MTQFDIDKYKTKDEKRQEKERQKRDAESSKNEPVSHGY